MNGIIEGGWNYVWAAYGLTALILGTYTFSVVLRLTGERRRNPEPVPVRKEPRR